MPVESVRLMRGNDFEERVFDQLAHDLQAASGFFIVTSPFKLESNREYDGMVISPHAVFTLEMKDIEGHVQKGANTAMTITDRRGDTVDLSNRYEDPIQQTDVQWKELKQYFQRTFGTENVFCRSLLVFPRGSTFSVPPENRQFHNHRASPQMVTIDEVVLAIKQFKPPYPVFLSTQVQRILLKSIREGAHVLTTADKELVKSIEGISTTATPPAASGRTAVAPRPAPTPPPRKPTAAPPPNVGPTLGARLRLWLSAALVFTAVLLFSNMLVALFWTGAYLFWHWRRWYRLATYVMIGALVFSAFRYFDFSTELALAGGLVWPLGLLFAGLALLSSPLVDVAPMLIDTTPTLRPSLVDEAEPAEIQNGPQQRETPDGVEDSEDASTPRDSQNGARLLVLYNSNVRSAPDIDSDPIGMAEQDAIFEILDETPDQFWYKIRLPNGVEGWIGSLQVDLVE